MCGDMNYCKETAFPDNPRYAELEVLFQDSIHEDHQRG
jgi:hypothetical protein